MRNLYSEFSDVREKLYDISMINTTNSLMEAYAENNDIDPEYRMPEFSLESSIEPELEYIDKLLFVTEKDNKNVLEACSSVEDKNPIGLSLDMVEEVDISATYKESSDKLIGLLKTAMESGDVDKVNSFTKAFLEMESDVTQCMKTTMCNGKKDDCGMFAGNSVGFVFNSVFDKKQDQKVTKECIKEAIEFLESGCKKKLQEVKKCAEEKCKSFKEKSCNLKGDMDKAVKVVHGSGKEEGCNKECSSKGPKNEAVASCTAVAAYLLEQDFMDRAYIVNRINQILEMNTQARKIVICANEYNPRNFVESFSEVQDIACVIESASNESYEVDNDGILLKVYQEGVKEKLQKLKATAKASNDKFLDKYEAKALSSPCDNITIETWYEFVDLKKKYDESLKKLKDLFKGANSKNPEELKDLYKDLKDKWGGMKAGKASKPVADFITPDGEREKSLGTFLSFAAKKVKNHKVTKQDVKDAVSLLKNISKEIDVAYKDFTKSNNQTLYAYDTGNRPGIGLSKAEKYSRKLTNLEKDYTDLLERNYNGALYWQLKAKQDQARLVVMKAAGQRSANESDIIDEELDSTYEELIMKL